ncbi:MAG: OmpA family protein [Bacteroidia bacterium]|nr:OmpA family protein [Bacteroidia bacterium]
MNLIVITGYSQDTINFKSAISKKEGDYFKQKYKSPTTNSKKFRYHKTGRWLFYDSLGNVIKEVNYSYNKKLKQSQKNGIEVYYNPNGLDTILIRQYRKGRLQNQLGFQSAIFKERGNITHIYKDFNSYAITQYIDKTGVATRKDFTMMWKSSYEDPNGLMDDSLYMAFEDSLGDASLMEPASFDTKSRYNYVSNPEFEYHPDATFSIVSFKEQIPGWRIASESPDLFISPEHARSGSGFVGFRVFSMKKHIEYLQNQLKAPLKKDSVYCFSAYIKLSPGSRFATNAFGFLLTENPQNINTDELLTVKASKSLESQVLLFKTRWMKIQCTYKAKGGETWLVLGSFQNHKNLSLKGLPGPIQECYYYLDDVSLVPIEEESECNCNFSDQRDTQQPEMIIDQEESIFTELSVGDKLILEDINFENDKDALLPESFSILNDLLVYLQKNNEVVVEISGHTSGIGGLEHNMDLSRRRAESVKTFLTLNGIPEERIETEGYGPKFPIASDDSEAGQLKNRRVEFKVVAM